MIYHELGRSGLKVSALSFGSMRWMTESACHEILRRGIEHGMNYIDTSTGYVRGLSYKWVGRAIKDCRDKVYYSSKSHWAQAPSADTVLRTIESVLEETGLDYVDLHQMWGIGSVELVKEAVKKGGTIEGVRRAQERGLVKHGVGFTFHGPPEAFRAAIDTGEFLSATVSYNLTNRQEEEQIAYAAEHGVGVIIMNPLAGGVLAMSTDRKLDFLRRQGTGPCYGALRYLLAHPHISTALIGFAALDEVDEDLRALEEPDRLTDDYRRSLIERMDAIEFTRDNLCTGCGYCKDCDNGFNPTQFMEFMRDFSLYAVDEQKLEDWLRTRYCHGNKPLEEILSVCIECGLCEKKCPQKLPIVKTIRRAKDVVGLK